MASSNTEKRKINRVQQDGSLVQILPETSAEQVTVDNTTAGITSTNLQNALKEINDQAKNGGVTGVKGSEETEYRKGNVSISADNVGAVVKNAPITGGTHTKITYDSKGLVTSGTNLSASDIPDLSATYQKKGSYATLGEDGKVPSSQLPAYVDDVKEYESKNAFPSIGTDSMIYIAKDTNLTYRWSGTDYIEISPSLALGETSSTAYAGDKGKANADAIAGLNTTVGEHTTAISTLETQQDTAGRQIQTLSQNLTNVINGTTPTVAKKFNSAKSIKITGAVKGSTTSTFEGETSINVAIDDNSIASSKLANVGSQVSGMSVFSTNAKGQVTESGTLIEFGTASKNTPSNNLVAGGIFFEYQA